MRVLLALYFISFFPNATSCFNTEEQSAKWNEAYGNQFKIDSELNDDSYSVVVSIPKYIEKQSFDLASIIISDGETPSFFATLQTFEEDGETKVWFLVKAGITEKHQLIFSYGEGCGISVTVPVVLN